MFKATIKLDRNLQNTFAKQKTDIRKIPEEAFKVFVENTPINKGNARRKTKLKNKQKIVADYPYAQKLDEGYSKQSPEGMVTPTEEFIAAKFNKIMSGK